MAARLASRLALWPILLLPGTALTQQADQPAIDPAMVEACFADAAADGGAPDCIGAAANQCQDQPGGATTPAITGCLMAEREVWDRLLNDAYGKTRAVFAGDATAAASLRDAQRAWIVWRDAECAFEYDRHGGGTMRAIGGAACQMRLTARRAFELRAMAAQ